MNLARTIARRWAFSTPFRHTRNILRIGMGSMGLCIAVMVISLCILVGFKNEVSNKVFGFGSHIVIQPYWADSQEESISIRWDSALQEQVARFGHVASAQAYALKGALIKGQQESHGVFFKGLPQGYDTVFFAGKLVKGNLPAYSGTGPLSPEGRVQARFASNQVLVSQFLAGKLELDTGSRLRAFFVHEGQLRPRSFRVSGIYATGLEKFDAAYILCDLAQIQALNGWGPLQADGIDLRLDDPSRRFDIAARLGSELPYEYSAFPCDLLFPEIFDWLALVDTNVLVLIIIMTIVCMICMVSLLFILIIERKPHIGVLKTLGASDKLVRRIFILQTLMIGGRAMLWGNGIALMLCLLQKTTGFLPLDESVYFLDRVPVAFPWKAILSTNAAVGLLAGLLLYFLSLLLNRTSPSELNRR